MTSVQLNTIVCEISSTNTHNIIPAAIHSSPNPDIFTLDGTSNTSRTNNKPVAAFHCLFRGEDHMVKALADPQVFAAIRDMIDQTVQGIHLIGLGTQGLRNMYGEMSRLKMSKA